MNRGAPPHPCEMGEVNMLCFHPALMADKSKISSSEFFQGQRLDRRSGQHPFVGYFSSINQALFRVSLVRGLGGFKPLMAQGIEVRDPPYVAPFIESLR